jgi:uncharacterized coiled-coil protein SlyX
MASGNRVEELESRVQELEATVDGLTDELADAYLALDEFENVVDGEVGLDAVGTSSSSDQPTETPASNDPEPSPEETESAEAPKSEGPDGEDNAEAGESDIIIA